MAALSKLARHDPTLEVVLINTVLAYQSDRSKPWSQEWDSQADSIWTSGRMSAGQKAKFAEQLADGVLMLHVDPAGPGGDPLHFEVSTARVRAGTNMLLMIRTSNFAVEKTGRDLPVVVPALNNPARVVTAGSVKITGRIARSQLPADWGPGPHELHLTCWVEISAPGRPATVLSLKPVTIVGSFTLAPRD